MDFGDKSPATILSINSCAAVRFIAASGRLPMLGKSHVLRQLSQSRSVEGATSRFFIVRSHVSDCWRNVVPETDAIDACNVSGLSAPLASMISLAPRFRSDAVKSWGPRVGQIFSRL